MCSLAATRLTLCVPLSRRSMTLARRCEACSAQLHAHGAYTQPSSYKKTGSTYLLKMATSRKVFSDVQKKAGWVPVLSSWHAAVLMVPLSQCLPVQPAHRRGREARTHGCAGVRQPQLGESCARKPGRSTTDERLPLLQLTPFEALADKEGECARTSAGRMYADAAPCPSRVRRRCAGLVSWRRLQPLLYVCRAR